MSCHTDPSSESLEIHSVLLEGKAPPCVHLLPSGIFSGQDGRGPYHVENIDEVIRASQSETGLVIDYDHQTDYAARPGVGMAAPAAGWIRDIEKRDDGIWGHVEWTPKAAQAIQQGEYRYLSPVFLHDDDGIILRILRAGLTNNPNLALKALNVDSHNQTHDTTQAIAQSLNIQGADDELSLQAILDAIAHLKQQTAAARDAYTQLLTLSGVTQTDANGDPDWSALQENLSKIISEQAAHASSLAQSLAMTQETASQQMREQRISEAIATGKIPPSLRSWAISYHNQDSEGFEQFLQGQPSLTLTSSVTPSSCASSSHQSALSEADLSICRQLNLDHQRFATARARFKDSDSSDSSTL